MRANRSIGGTLDDNAIDATLNGVSPNHTYDTVGGTGSSGRRRTIKLLTFYNPSPGTINVDIHKSNADVTFIPISIKNAGGAVTQHNLGIAGTAVLGNTASISAPPGAGKAFTQPAFFVAGAVRHCSRHRGDDARPRRVLPGTRDTASSTARLSRTRAEAPGRGSRSASESMSRGCSARPGPSLARWMD